jgi:hypothetical protein
MYVPSALPRRSTGLDEPSCLQVQSLRMVSTEICHADGGSTTRMVVVMVLVAVRCPAPRASHFTVWTSCGCLSIHYRRHMAFVYGHAKDSEKPWSSLSCSVPSVTTGPSTPTSLRFCPSSSHVISTSIFSVLTISTSSNVQLFDSCNLLLTYLTGTGAAPLSFFTFLKHANSPLVASLNRFSTALICGNSSCNLTLALLSVPWSNSL